MDTIPPPGVDAAPHGIALDIANDHMYWVDNGLVKIQRADLDGSNSVDILTSTTASLQRSWDLELVFAPEPSADFDLDGDVDGDDFLTWQTGFGTQLGAQKSDGDYDNDGDVDGDDFLGWQAEFGSGSGSASAAVPEPASVVLLFVLATGGILSRRGGISRP